MSQSAFLPHDLCHASGKNLTGVCLHARGTCNELPREVATLRISIYASTQ
jgi:hypothetical protein